MNKKHDSYFRYAFSEPTRAAELLQLAAQQNENLAKFLQTIDLSSLTEISESYSDVESNGYADLAFTVKLKPAFNLSADLLVGILMEHKSTNRDDVLKQLIRYWFQIMVKKQDHIPTVAIIIYNGKEAWKPALKTLYPEYPEYYHQIGLPFVCEFVDVGEAIEMKEFQNLSPKTAIALVAMKYIFEQPKHKDLFDHCIQNFLALPEKERDDFLSKIMLYLGRSIPQKDKEAVQMDFVSVPEVYGFKSIYDACLEETEEKFRAETAKKAHQEKLEMVKAMLQDGLSLDKAAKYSGLSVEEIESLK